MNLFQSDFALLYLAAITLIVWGLIYWQTKSLRSKQWLQISTLVGLVLGLFLPMVLKITSGQLERVAYLSQSGSWAELAIVAALIWGIVATIPQIIDRHLVAPLPIKVGWWKLGMAGILIWLGAAIASALNTDSSIGVIASIGLLALMVVALQPRLIKAALISGLFGLILSLGVSTALVWFTPKLATFLYLSAALPQTASLPLMLLGVLLGIAAPLLSWWWFNQPLAANSPKPAPVKG